MMYHIQPWMLIGLFPLAFCFEVLPAIQDFFNPNFHPAAAATSLELPLDVSYFWQIVHLILIGSILAFLMEFSEYLLLSFTSSLTLSMAGIFKEIFTLYLAVNLNGDQMSATNFIGLIVCLLGIITHVLLKAIDTHSSKFSFTFSNKTRFINHYLCLDIELHSIPRAIKSEEIEAKRLLDDEVIHFDIQSNGTAMLHTFGAKNT